MASGDRPDRLRPWNALAIALLALYLVGIGLFCYAALTTTPEPSPYAITDGPLAAYGNPRAWWPVALQLALGLGAFGAYYWPRRHETRSFSLLITGGLGVSTIVPDESSSPTQLIMAADEALYDAKRRGRNCVVQRSVSVKIVVA